MKRNLKKLSAVFSQAVHQMAQKDSIPLVEAAVHQCEIFNIDQDSLHKYLTPSLVELIKVECSKLKMLKPSGRVSDSMKQFFQDEEVQNVPEL